MYFRLYNGFFVYLCMISIFQLRSVFKVILMLIVLKRANFQNYYFVRFRKKSIVYFTKVKLIILIHSSNYVGPAMYRNIHFQLTLSYSCVSPCLSSPSQPSPAWLLFVPDFVWNMRWFFQYYRLRRFKIILFTTLVFLNSHFTYYWIINFIVY